MIPESKPQGSEQPLNPCQHCDESQVLEFGHSQGQIRVECPCGASGPWCDTFNAAESQWNKVNPLPNPSADEEVETPSGQKLFRQWCGNSYEWDALTDLERQRWNRLSQQHNAEREAEYHRGRSHELTEGDWVNRVETLQAELATAQKTVESLDQLHEISELFMHCRICGEEVGQDDSGYWYHSHRAGGPQRHDHEPEPRPSREWLEKEADQTSSLRSQLQTAMEERDAAIRNRDEWRNAATESKQAYGAANSRLEEAEKVITKKNNAIKLLEETVDGGIAEAEILKHSLRHIANSELTPGEYRELALSSLSRLSTSRSTGRKDNTL